MKTFFLNSPVVTFQDKTDIQVCLWKVKLVVQTKTQLLKSDFLSFVINMTMLIKEAGLRKMDLTFSSN